MSERNGSTAAGTGTAEIPAVRPAGPGTAQTVTLPPPGEPGTQPAAQPAAPEGEAAHADRDDVVPGMQATAPVNVRPRPRMPRRGPLTVMGPWAPVAGGLLGLLVGLIAVLLLAGTAAGFEDRLALVFVVLGFALVGTAGALLGDEVRMMRQRSREAAVRPASVEATAGLLNGLTPGRLLLLGGGFVLFLAAYVSR